MDKKEDKALGISPVGTRGRRLAPAGYPAYLAYSLARDGIAAASEQDGTRADIWHAQPLWADTRRF